MSARSRPLVGLTGLASVGARVAGLPATFAELSVDVYISAYAEAVSAAGGVPVHLARCVDIAAYAGRLDGVMLTGGADLEPGRYGADPAPELEATDPRRDTIELALADLAAAEGLAVLGICRGLQLLNVHGGGTLIQHVDGHSRFDVPSTECVDEVTFVRGSRLHSLLGDCVAVNSLHHQAVDRIAPGWEVVGRSRDGGVEAIERSDGGAVAVQWHPELLAGAADDRLFSWLVEAATTRRNGRDRPLPEAVRHPAAGYSNQSATPSTT